jgi:type IV fimbrial biogenesis protein FimT
VHVMTVRQSVRMRTRHSEAGFNLVELLVVISVASILMGLGVSSYRYVTNSSRVSSEINGLLGDMQVARSEAVKRGQTVTVCPSSNGATCTGSAWTGGWIVFTDWTGNGSVDTSAPDNDTILRIQSPWTTGDAITTNNVAIQFISFNRNGLALNMPTDGSDFVLTLNTNPTATTWRRCLDITTTGGMQTERQGDPSGNCP